MGSVYLFNKDFVIGFVIGFYKGVGSGFLECDFEVDFLKGGLNLKVWKKSKGPTRSKKVRP